MFVRLGDFGDFDYLVFPRKVIRSEYVLFMYQYNCLSPYERVRHFLFLKHVPPMRPPDLPTFKYPVFRLFYFKMEFDQ